jgi:ABC-type lipoprotein release transport system permease subunit
MTSGAIGAFMLGVRDEEFFIGEADNILVVTQPGVTTPFTGQVPESMQDDIQKIKGIISISPETLGLSIAQNLNEKPIIVRGITSNFTKLTPTNVTTGVWFNPIFDQIDDTQTKNIQVNGAMIGYLLASTLGLKCGDKIQLASTVTDMVIDVVITGIIRSNSPCDEEMLVSLTLGKSISGTQFSFVSILRVLFDEEIISRETLSDIMNTEYTVPISLCSDDPRLADRIVGTPIVAYTTYGEHVETKLIEYGNITEFKLQFGTYEFVAAPPEASNSPPLNLFVNQSFHSAFEIKIGGNYYDLQLNVTYNKQPSNNASVLLRNRFKPEERNYSYTNEEGLVQFLDISESFYRISVGYKEIVWKDAIRLNQSMQLNVELDCSLTLTILNISSEQEVEGGIVNIFRNKNLINVFNDSNYQSGTPIYLDHGNYQVEFSHDDILRKYSILVNESVHKTIYVGTASLRILIRGENTQGLDSTNVSIGRYDGVILQNLTRSDGTCEFQLEVGLNYNVTTIPAENQSRVYNQTIFFSNPSSLIINFLDSYRLDIEAINGTLGSTSNNVLTGVNIVILRGSNTVVSGITNSSGQMAVDLSEPGIYKVIAEKDGFNLNKILKIDFRTQNCMIRLGKAHLLVSAQSVTGYPISGVSISVRKETEIFDHGTTNSSGFLELFFPVGRNYTLSMSKEGFVLSQNISFVESQYVSIVKIIELSGTLSISLTNQIYQEIPKAQVVLTNDYYNIEYMEFTNDNGEAVFYEIPWGNFSVYISYYKESFPRYIIDLAVNEVEFDIQINMENPYEDLYNYANIRSVWSFSVIPSSKYVSGFLHTTLEIFIAIFTSLVIIVSVLSLLSIASVISHPIVSNERTLKTFQQLGATRNQVILGVVIHLSLLGVIASVFGSLLGMWIMTFFPSLRNMNIGGVIISPKIDSWLILLIVLSNLIVVISKAGQKTREIYHMS